MGIALVIGTIMSATNVAVISQIQEQTPSELLGMVMSVLMFSSMSLTPLSYAVSGVVARALGAKGLFILGGVLVVVVAGAGFTVRAMRQFGQSDPSSA